MASSSQVWLTKRHYHITVEYDGKPIGNYEPAYATLNELKEGAAKLKLHYENLGFRVFGNIHRAKKWGGWLFTAYNRDGLLSVRFTPCEATWECENARLVGTDTPPTPTKKRY